MIKDEIFTEVGKEYSENNYRIVLRELVNGKKKYILQRRNFYNAQLWGDVSSVGYDTMDEAIEVANGHIVKNETLVWPII